MMKNAGMVGKTTVAFPHSKLKNAILECLKKEGYVKEVSKKTKAGRLASTRPKAKRCCSPGESTCDQSWSTSSCAQSGLSCTCSRMRWAVASSTVASG